jgi:hypothetical protein
MNTDEVITATRITAAYRWTANESLNAHAWVTGPAYKKGGKGLLKWVIGLLLSGFVFATLVVILVESIRSPASLSGSEFWRDLFMGWVESSGTFAKLVGLFVLVFGGFWIEVRYISPWLQRRRVRQYFSRNPDAEIDIRVTIDAQALTWEFGDATQTTNKWKVYREVVKTPDGFLFFPGNGYTWIPDHAFQSQQDISLLCQWARSYANRYREIA